MRLIPCIALLLLVTLATNANAQIRDPILGTRTAITTAPDTTILALTHRIEALESLVAALQQKTAFIKSASPLMLDAGSENLTIRSANAVVVEAGSTLGIRAGSSASLTSSSSLYISGATTLDLYGRPIRHNGGGTPLACALQTTNQIIPCDANVQSLRGPQQ
jgi:hypothetical protein